MSLSAGTKLGPYEILAPIGAGGMGEVYRAKDTKLEREVAIKVLPAALARDPERLARFEREAKVLASLNHPNIAQLYGIEESSMGRALVMELVPGHTLKGPFELKEALRIARLVAEALEAAHDKGIIHRDLKPANIMVTLQGVVKVLDFGLAAVTQSSDACDNNPSNSPTLTMGATQAGMILGTAGYMSPEQAAGQPVDKRADIWAFGVVLWEMLTGRHLFTGDTAAHILADVLRGPIDFGQLPAGTPTTIRNLLRRCLNRDVKKRLRDIGEARIAIEDSLSGVQQGAETLAPSGPQERSILPWAIAGVLAITLTGTAWFAYRATQPVEKALLRLNMDLGPDAVAGYTVPAISPDGTRLVFPVRGAGGKQQLATRLLDQTTTIPLPGTENAAQPFFSPDGQWIGFFADGKLRRTPIQGGTVLTLCDVQNPSGGSWGEDGNIVMSTFGTAESLLEGGLWRVPAIGGKPRQVGEQIDRPVLDRYRWPQVLPGAATVLFSNSASGASWEDANIEAQSLTTGVIKTVVRGGYFGRYLRTNSRMGHLVYVHEGTLFAVPFDPAKLELRGAAVPVLEDVAADVFRGLALLDVSQNGYLVYRTGGGAARTYPVVWLESSGKTQPLLPTPGVYYTPRISPDGQRLALAMGPEKGRDIYIYDMARATFSRITFNGGASRPLWNPDGRHLVYRLDQAGSHALWWLRADGAGEPLRLLEDKRPLLPDSFSPDGRLLVYNVGDQVTKADIWNLPLDLTDPEHPKPGRPVPLLVTKDAEAEAAISPDGRWVSYLSMASGRAEIFVRHAPSSGGAQGGKSPEGMWQISNGGGTWSFWSRNGRELFYQSQGQRIMVVPYSVMGDSFVAGQPRVWSETPTRQVAPGFPHLDLAPDGKRFATFPSTETPNDDKDSQSVSFVLNFFDELRRKVPTGK